MSLRAPNLIEEAIAVNHAQVSKPGTLARYDDHLQPGGAVIMGHDRTYGP